MFKSWCATQNFTNATNLSHVLMDGGVLSVPFDKLNDFHERYVEAVKRGEKLYVVEQKTPFTTFSWTSTIRTPKPLTSMKSKISVKVICDKVKRHGGKDCPHLYFPP